MKTLNPDIAIIGGGSGGLSVAAGAVQMGARVVLVERGKMGGDCLNYGCVPSKALLAAAHYAYQPEAAACGIKNNPQVDFARVHDHVHQVIAAIAPHDSVERFTKMGVEVLAGNARFISRREIAVDEQYHVCAKFFVIATGSSPAIPPIKGLSEVSFFTNETIFDNRELPRHLVIIGGGPIGIEMAQAHLALGAQVTVLDTASILPRDDAECVDLLRARLCRDGLQLHERISISAVRQKMQGIVIEATDVQGNALQLCGSHLMIAAGRCPNVSTLALDTAGIQFDLRGITVDQRLRSVTNKRVFAIGDVVGGYQFTHIAAYHAGIVIRNALFRLPVKTNYTAVPWVTYTQPELAHVGLSWDEAKKRFGKPRLRVLRWSLQENDRAQAECATDGLLKAIVTRQGEIIGVDIVGRQAGELIQPWILAIQNRLKISAMASYIAPYPTLGEANKRLAGNFYIDTLFSPRVRKLVRILLKLP